MERLDVVGFQAAGTAALNAPPAVAVKGRPARPGPTAPVQHRVISTPGHSQQLISPDVIAHELEHEAENQQPKAQL